MKQKDQIADFFRKILINYEQFWYSVAIVVTLSVVVHYFWEKSYEGMTASKTQETSNSKPKED